MQLSDMLHIPASRSKDEANAILEELDGFILRLARKNIPRNVLVQSEMNQEIDDLAQNIRVKLWLAMGKGTLINKKAYLRSIAYTEAVDIVRKFKRVYPLTLDWEGELCQGNVLGRSNQEERDPASEFEREETLSDIMQKTVDEVLKLPTRQQRAMICALKDQVADILPLAEAFAARGLDIGAINWPRKKDQVRQLRASLGVARAKLRSKRSC